MGIWDIADPTDLWTVSTTDGSFRQITDSKRRTLIASYIYAAVVENDADIMLLDGMLP
jgi:hypothetical protein